MAMRMLWVSFLVLPALLLEEASALKDTSDTSSCSAKFLEKRRVNSSGIHLALHHVHGRCSPTRLPPRPSTELLKHDEHRVQALISRLKGATKAKRSSHRRDDLRSEAIRSPLRSGRFIGSGNYVVSVGLGTPAVAYIMTVDTGSSLNWLQCRPCDICHLQVGLLFNPSASFTYTTIGCSSFECAATRATTLHRPGCGQNGVCLYEADYGDGSFSAGHIGKDRLNFAGGVVPNFVFGCGHQNEGLLGQSSGLLGLSKDKLSMLGQLAPTYGNIFSYCLPTTSGTGYLSFGPDTSLGYIFTPLVSSSSQDTGGLYSLDLIDIVVAQKSIPMSAAAYASNPTIIDSGTVITRLPWDIYKALSQAIVAALPGRARAKSPASLFDTCYVGSYMYLQLPSVQMVFGGGASITLPPQNVFYDLTSQGVTCLAFAGSSSITIIGNRQHQTFGVVYDVGRSKIGFASGGCS